MKRKQTQKATGLNKHDMKLFKSIFATAIGVGEVCLSIEEEARKKTTKMDFRKYGRLFKRHRIMKLDEIKQAVETFKGANEAKRIASSIIQISRFIPTAVHKPGKRLTPREIPQLQKVAESR